MGLGRGEKRRGVKFQLKSGTDYAVAREKYSQPVVPESGAVIHGCFPDIRPPGWSLTRDSLGGEVG